MQTTQTTTQTSTQTTYPYRTTTYTNRERLQKQLERTRSALGRKVREEQQQRYVEKEGVNQDEQ